MPGLSGRLWALYSILPLILVGVPVWWKTTTVNQLALPSAVKSGQFEQDVTKFVLPVHISVAAHESCSWNIPKYQQALTQHLKEKIKDLEWQQSAVEVAVKRLCEADSRVVRDRMTTNGSEDMDDFLLSFPGSAESSHSAPDSSYSLLVIADATTTHSRGTNPPPIVLGAHRHGWMTVLTCPADSDLNALAKRTVQGVLALVAPDRYLPLYAPKDAKHRMEAQLTKPRGKLGHHLVFSLLQADPDASKTLLDWDFPAARVRGLDPLLSQVKPITALSVRSRTRYYATLPVLAPWDAKAQAFVISQRALQSLVIPEDWTPPALEFDEPGVQHAVLHLVTFVPSPAQSPLLVQAGDGSLQHSFVVHGWGGIHILNMDWNHTDTDATSHDDGRDDTQSAETMPSTPTYNTLPLHTIHEVLAQFHPHLRVLLGIGLPRLAQVHGLTVLAPRTQPKPAAGASARAGGGGGPPGMTIAAWELDNLARRHLILNQRNTAESLASLNSLVNTLPNMAVEQPVYRAVERALHALHESSQMDGDAAGGESLAPPVTADGLHKAINQSAWALRWADEAFFQPSVLGFLYFPEEHKYAIYVPFFVPVLVPVVLTVLSEVRHWLQQRMDARERAKQHKAKTE